MILFGVKKGILFLALFLINCRAFSWSSADDSSYDDFSFEDDDSDDYFRFDGAPQSLAKQPSVTGFDQWTKEQMDAVDKRYMEAQGILDPSQYDPNQATAVTKEYKDIAISIAKSLNTGFSLPSLERAARDPYFFIDRSSLQLVSGPVVDAGLWKVLVDSFYSLKSFYLDYIQDFGTKRKTVPDRLLLLKLKDLSKCQALNKAEHNKGGTRPYSESTPANAHGLWETSYIQSSAKAIGSMMPIAMAGRWHYMRPGCEPGRSDLFGEDGGSRTFHFVQNGVQTKRHTSVRNTGLPRLYHLGSLTYFSVLDRALYLQDQVHPYHEEMAKLHHLFAPTGSIRDNEKQNPVIWKPTASAIVEKSLVLLAQCLAEIDI